MTKALKKSDDIKEPGCDLARSCVNWFHGIFGLKMENIKNLSSVQTTYFQKYIYIIAISTCIQFP